MTTPGKAKATKKVDSAEFLLAPELIVPTVLSQDVPCATERAAYADAYANYIEALEEAHAALQALEACESDSDPEEPEGMEAFVTRLDKLALMKSVLAR